MSETIRGCSKLTPWGYADSSEVRAPGIVFYSTPSHGGFELSAERLAELERRIGPVKVFNADWPHWFEEDCDWAHIAVAFPEYFNADELRAAKGTLSWMADRPLSATTLQRLTSGKERAK